MFQCSQVSPWQPVSTLSTQNACNYILHGSMGCCSYIYARPSNRKKKKQEQCALENGTPMPLIGAALPVPNTTVIINKKLGNACFNCLCLSQKKKLFLPLCLPKELFFRLMELPTSLLLVASNRAALLFSACGGSLRHCQLPR